MFEQKIFCAQYKGDGLLQSASGGVFFAFAKYVIENGGCVFGAAYDDFPELKHICVDSVSSLSKLQGSKYVESDFIHVLPILKKKVEEGQLVLFSGTPCQIAAVRSFLKFDFGNLLMLDIVCHGTPDKKVFQAYIKWREKKWNAKILSYEFRNKKVSPWGENQKGLILTDKGCKIIPSECDPYFCAFQKGLIAQKKCYSCKYASSSRLGDISAADFWSVKLFFPNFPYSKGASCLFVNTMKGEMFFEKVKKFFLIENASFEQASKWNPHLRRPLAFNAQQTEIYDIIKSGGGFDAVLRFIPSVSYPLYIYRLCICWVKKKIKKLLRL